jgi:hypothetical protein
MVGKFHIDWGWGTIKSRDDSYSIRFSLGSVSPAIPLAGSADFRWIKEETIGTNTLRYGLNTRKRRMLATVGVFNLEGPLVARERFVAISRLLAGEGCRWQSMPQ